jgi:hypothetical protein
MAFKDALELIGSFSKLSQLLIGLGLLMGITVVISIGASIINPEWNFLRYKLLKLILGKRVYRLGRYLDAILFEFTTHASDGWNQQQLDIGLNLTSLLHDLTAVEHSACISKVQEDGYVVDIDGIKSITMNGIIFYDSGGYISSYLNLALVKAARIFEVFILVLAAIATAIFTGMQVLG